MHKNYKGIYDKRLVGTYNNKIVYIDKEDGYIIEEYYRHTRTASKKEIKEIKEKFGDLEKKVKEFRII